MTTKLHDGAETGCLVYAVVRPEEREALPPAGVDDAPLRLVVHGTVAAVVNEIAVQRPPGRRADLMAYSRVLDGLLPDGVVVPVQFGSVVPDDSAVVEELLAPNEDYFAELFEQLAGRSQLNVRATYRDGSALAEIVAGDTEIAELQARTKDLPEDAALTDRLRLGQLVADALDAVRDRDSAMLWDAIIPMTVGHRLVPGTGTDAVCDLIVLVDDGRVTEVEERLEELAEAVHPRMRLRLVGPVPPYDFIGDVSWA